MVAPLLAFLVTLPFQEGWHLHDATQVKPAKSSQEETANPVIAFFDACAAATREAEASVTQALEKVTSQLPKEEAEPALKPHKQASKPSAVDSPIDPLTAVLEEAKAHRDAEHAALQVQKAKADLVSDPALAEVAALKKLVASLEAQLAASAKPAAPSAPATLPQHPAAGKASGRSNGVALTAPKPPVTVVNVPKSSKPQPRPLGSALAPAAPATMLPPRPK